MSAPLTITMPCPPPVSAAYSNISPAARAEAAKRGQRLPGRRRTKRYLTWARAAGNELLAQARHAIDGPCMVDITCKRRRSNEDIDNKIKVVLDFLQDVEIIGNDKNVNEVRARWGDVEGAVVTIIPLAAEAAE